ncbi:MAG: hydroxymethylbilane synthase [Flavobacteriaceae bacterium]
MSRLIRIGTRGSALALWQARWVQTLLASVGLKSELVPIASSGDQQLQKPLYEMGVQGIFTKELDVALLAGEIDIAVHSMKDVPTQLPEGIVTAFVPKRGLWQDVFIPNKKNWKAENSTIATSSLRRAAQWRYTFPTHNIVDIRGNVPTRLKKLRESSNHGTVMALAGLTRLEMLPENSVVLDWMIPAPAQGAVLVTGLEKNQKFLASLKPLNHNETARCVEEERLFLRVLEGGCTAPIGAHAQVVANKLHFRGCITQKEGTKQLLFDQSFSKHATDIGKKAAESLLEQGAKELLDA